MTKKAPTTELHTILHDTRDEGEVLRLLREGGWFDGHSIHFTEKHALSLWRFHWPEERQKKYDKEVSK